MLSAAFGDVLSTACAAADVTGLRLIIYIDELCPGNPLRPEKSRTLQAIYWAFADWPQWLLQRTAAWPTFGTIRSTIVKKLPGGVAGLMTRILGTFFPLEGNSMMRGVAITLHDGTTRLVTATFGGFLCDEKAHNELSDTNGASGGGALTREYACLH